MPQSFLIKVFDKTLGSNEKLLFEGKVDRSFRIGRQEAGEPDEVKIVESEDEVSKLDRKLVIASVNEREYSRRFAEIHLSGERIEVKNTSANQPIFSGSAIPIQPQQSRILNVPTDLTFGNRTISIGSSAPAMAKAEIRSLPVSSPPSLMTLHSPTSFRSLSMMGAEVEDPMQAEHLLELLKTVLEILQNSPNCQEFFDNAAKTIAQLLELDNILIAFDEKNKPDYGGESRSWDSWHSQSLFTLKKADAENWTPSTQILDVVYQQKKTVFQIPDVRTDSLMGVCSLVASPLRNADNEVIGVIYGDREISGHSNMEFREIDAMFVEVFANGISVGLERLGQEQQISQIRARFDQFFTQKLARQLEANPKMLEPRSAQVSVLFADIRGFSRIAERIGPAKSIRWINSVMSELSDCILKHDGVVVDYVGDEVMAMWGAPLEQEDHAQLAVLAALEMLERLPGINDQWKDIVGEPIDFGIGINSGEAQVGNTGSDRKFKYGPLGNVVNVGSRLQGATKQLKARLLITESTANSLSKDLIRRRIRSLRFVNVEGAVSVFEIPFRPDDAWKKLKAKYEEGLELYESGKFALASQQMASLINDWPDDGPSLLLLADSVRWLQSGGTHFDPVWQLIQK